MAVDKRGGVWWYHFSFAGRHIQESTKSTRKTIAIEAEKNRRLELERSFNAMEDRRRERVRSVSEVADQFFEDYKVRNPKSETFADYALGYLMLSNETQVTIRGLVVVQPKPAASSMSASA